MVANLIKVKVDPKDLKSIPDILPYRVLLQGDPMELELTKKEILRCMNFGDVYDLTSGEEVLIDEISFQDIVEYVEEEEETEEESGEDEDLDTGDESDEDAESDTEEESGKDEDLDTGDESDEDAESDTEEESANEDTETETVVESNTEEEAKEEDTPEATV